MSHFGANLAERIVESVNAGYGIIPILGAGISVPSGIPAGPRLQSLLFSYVYEAVENEWSPAEGSWPRQLPVRDPAAAFKTWLNAWGDPANTGDANSDPRVYLEAIGSYADWRLMLPS